MYAKFVDGKFTRSRYGISEEEALSLGFKPVVLTKAPETEEGYHPEEWLEETETQIIRHWNIVADPVDPDPDIDDAEAYNIIFGGAE